MVAMRRAANLGAMPNMKQVKKFLMLMLRRRRMRRKRKRKGVVS